MIDLHCHILPGIDDGPEEIGESLEMARIAAADGVTTIVATPHVNETAGRAALIRQKVEELNALLSAKGVPVTILRGGDVNAGIDPALLRDFTVNGSDYILLEFPYTYLPLTTREILFSMSLSGYLPIITHPERNPTVIKNPGALLELLDGNILVQITASSLTGGFGREAQECAVHLLERGAVSFIASDAHGAAWRPPVLSEGLRVAEEIIGRQRALRLVTAYPEAVLSGRALHAA